MPPAATANSRRINFDRFLKGEGPETGTITLNQRRIFILPSQQGLYFALLLILMLIGSINYSNSMGYLLTFLLASLAVTTILHTYKNLLHLRIDLIPIKPTYAGQSLELGLRIDNQEQRARQKLDIEFKRGPKNTWQIPADETVMRTLRGHAYPRGKHSLPHITLSSVYPLGLFRAWSHLRYTAEFIVYPKPHGHRPLPFDMAYHPHHEGDRGHGSDDFSGLRPYHPGDSPRHIHWKAVAREQGVHSKQFGGDRQEELYLDWQLLTRMDDEARLAQICQWILQAHEQQLHYGLQLPSIVIAPAAGEAHKNRCLLALALYPEAP